MGSLNIDSGYRGSAVYCNYKMECLACKAKLASYFLYADRERQKMMESGEFEKKKDHICPKCRKRTVRIIRKMTLKESHFRLNAHKNGMMLPSKEEIESKTLDDYNAAIAYRNHQENLEFTLKKEGLPSDVIEMYVGDKFDIPDLNN